MAKLVNIDYKIQNGDRIEILTSPNSKGPSRDWLNIVKSTQAKNKINQWFKKEFKEENIVRGREMIAAYCRAKGINMVDVMKPKYQQIVQQKYGFQDWDSALAAIGHGGMKEGQIVNRLLEEFEKDHRKEITDETILETGGRCQQAEDSCGKIEKRNRGQRHRRYGGSFFQVLYSGAGG